MDWDFEDIPRLTEELLANWRAKHPNYKPSFSGKKIEMDDQSERDRCRELEPCLRWYTGASGYRHQVPGVRFKQPSVYYQEREAIRKIYDERQF